MISSLGLLYGHIGAITCACIAVVGTSIILIKYYISKKK